MYSASQSRDETVLAVPLPAMKDPLVRFGVAVEGSLLRELDALARKRGCTRSELLRDLGRAEVGRAKVPDGVDAVGALTLVYDHHTRDLSEKLTALQHDLGDDVRAAMHVHLSNDLCLEVIVLRGRSDHLAALSEQILAIRGVKHGGIEIVTSLDGAGHTHDDGHPHLHDHPHPHPRAPARVRRPPRARRK
jgi:CopG family transcriptional regulator, nickel-responsive regulator